MTTAVDTNVLLDLLGADPEFGPRSKAAFDVAADQGALVACGIVWAEVSAWFPSSERAHEVLGRLEVGFSPMGPEACLEAGRGWAAYRQRGGARSRVVSDFLIGAHALLQADRLLTRDTRFHRSYFERLDVMDPTRP